MRFVREGNARQEHVDAHAEPPPDEHAVAARTHDRGAFVDVDADLSQRRCVRNPASSTNTLTSTSAVPRGTPATASASAPPSIRQFGSVQQRFGSAANLHLHAHVLVLDGVFTEQQDGTLRFDCTAPPTDAELAQLLNTIVQRVLQACDRLNPADDAGAFDNDLMADEAPALASCYAGSIRSRQVLGSRPGAALARMGHDPHAVWAPTPLRVHTAGFDLHAGVTMAAQWLDARGALERLVRYCARPALSHDRLSELPDGRVALRLKTPWRDGTTHVLHEPLDFLAKLAALIPRPHKDTVLYHGVLAAHSKLRARVTAYGRPADGESDEHAHRHNRVAATPVEVQKRSQWTELMRRAFGLDVLRCKRCGRRLRLVACVLERAAIEKILSHIGMGRDPPRG